MTWDHRSNYCMYKVSTRANVLNLLRLVVGELVREVDEGLSDCRGALDVRVVDHDVTWVIWGRGTGRGRGEGEGEGGEGRGMDVV